MKYQLGDDDAARCKVISQSGRPKIRAIVEAVAEASGIPPSAIYAENRRKHVAQARQLAMYLARKEGASLPTIASVMRRDHSTVLHGIRQEERRRGEGRTD